MRSLLQAFSLAMRDYRHEALLSACSVLGLAAVLAPLLVLLGVHHGIISAMTDRLLNDPRTLEVIPVGSGKYGPSWFEELTALPETAFVLPQTRSIAATVTLLHGPRDAGKSAVTPITASAAGDPQLRRWQESSVGWSTARPSIESQETTPQSPSVPAQNSQSNRDTGCLVAEVTLSESLARKLAAAPGDLLESRVDRVRNGRRESASLSVRVMFILPPEAQATDMLFVPLELMVATEDYRDGKAVPFLNWDGDIPELPANGSGKTAASASSSPGTKPQGTTAAIGAAGQESSGMDGSACAEKHSQLDAYAVQIRDNREYASFRMYAKSLDDVTPLWRWFQERHVEVYVKSAEIETVKSLDRAFSIVFSLIAGAALFGFMASTASSALAGVRRKSRSLGVMRLVGFTRGAIMLFPLSQSLATAFLGSLLALVLYTGVAYSIDTLFSSSLPGGAAICSLPSSYAAAVLGLVLLLSALSSLAAARQATTIEPSEVIRDV